MRGAGLRVAVDALGAGKSDRALCVRRFACGAEGGMATAPPWTMSQTTIAERNNAVLTSPTALVLSGGGARGAYQVGVLAGIVELMGEARFDLFVGASAGALNAAYFAAHAREPRMNVDGLVRLWRSLRLKKMLRLMCAPPRSTSIGRSLLDPRPIEALIAGDAIWSRLHHAIEERRVAGLIIPALRASTGRTSVFAELAPGVRFRAWKSDARLRFVPTRLGPAHVLASAAIPLLLPARLIDGEAYCDGGLRMCSPLAPAIRAGARKMVVVTLRSEGLAPVTDASVPVRVDDIGNPFFLAGKVLDGLLLDPVDHDLANLTRINGFVRALDRTLASPERALVDDDIARARGAAYRSIDALVFSPSIPLPTLAVEALDRLARRAPPSTTSILRELTRRAAAEEADLASFLLLDEELAGPLIELGRADARARKDEVAAFFARGPGALPAAHAP